jgi:hypothetical protein
MVRNLEHLKQAAPNPFLLDLVETAWSWRGQESAIAKRPRSGLVNTITEVAPDPAAPSVPTQAVYWEKVLSRPKILVDIGEQASATGLGGLARTPTGWVFKDFATNSDVANAIAAIPPPDPLALNDLTDVTIASALSGHNLTFNGLYWVNEPGPRHRFPINDDGTYDFDLAYDPVTKILTMIPVGSSFYVHIKGVKYTFTGTQTLPPHTTAEKTFIFVNSSGQLEMGTSGFNLLAHAPVAVIYWDAVASTGFCVPERHTDRMSARTHERLHEVQGAEAGRRSGFAISGYTYNLDTVAGVTFGVSGGKVWDEDIPHIIPNFADGSTYTIFRRAGATGSWTWETASTLPYKTGTNYATSNVFSGGAWTQQELDGSGTGQFMNMFVVGLPNINIEQIILVQGQGVFTTQALAEAQTWDTLDIGTLPSFEMPPLYQVVLKSQVALGTATKKTVIVSIKKVATSGGGSGVGGSTVHNSLSGRSDADTHPFTSLTGILGSSQFPTLTGDVANTALATTVNGLKGFVLPTLGAAANLRWSGSAWTMDANSYALVSSLSAYAPLADLSSYVLKAGDTMSGTLYAPSVSLTGALSLPTWDIATNVSNEMVFKKSGTVKVWFKTADIVTSMNLLPNGPGQTLGGSGTEWNARLNSAWIGSSTGMLKTVAGEVQIAGESDLPGGPFLHASGGSTNKVAKWTSPTTLGYGIATDDGTTFSVAGNGSFTGAVDAGNARIQSSAIGTGGWFGYPGKNTAGAYIGSYAFSDGSIRIASQTGQSVSIGSGANYGALVAGDDGVRMSNLTSGGMVKADFSTGLLKIASASDSRLSLAMPDTEVVFGSTALGISSSPRMRFYGDDLHFDSESRVYFHAGIDTGRGGNIREKYNSSRSSMELIIESPSQSDGNSGIRFDFTDGSAVTPIATFEAGGVDYDGPCAIFHEPAYFDGGIHGQEDSSSAGAGFVGEYITSALPVGSAATISASGTAINMTGISLPAGDWDVMATIIFSANVSGLTRAQAAISTVSATVTSDGYESDGVIASVSGSKLCMSMAKKISTAGEAVYLSAVMTGTFGAGQCWGNLSARRRR